jgi:hypothetical protein
MFFRPDFSRYKSVSDAVCAGQVRATFQIHPSALELELTFPNENQIF